MAGEMKEVDLGALGEGGVEIDGLRDGIQNGGVITALGDINGDGFDDFSVTSGFWNRTHPNYDMVFYGSGNLAPLLGPSELDGRHGFSIRDDDVLHSAGDMNGDGVDDLMVETISPTFYYQGTVLYGDPDRNEAQVSLPTEDGPDGLILKYPHHAALGDVNGDGFDDVLNFGANYYYNFVNLNLGGPTGTSAEVQFQSTRDVGGLGAALGDINGDGYDDFQLLGALVSPGHEGFYVVFGRPDLSDPIDLDHLTPDQGFVESWSFKQAGDINGDGFGDFVIGRSLVFGHAGPWSDVGPDGLDGKNGFAVTGAVAETPGLYMIGDVNGDGFDDLAYGDVADSTNGADAGAVYVIFGHAKGFHKTVDVNQLTDETGMKILGALAGNRIGGAVALGDVNGDGIGDIGISDPNHLAASTGYDSGAAYIVYGQQPDTAVKRVGGDLGQNLAGGAFDDKLFGMGGDDTLWGNGGRDRLEGGDGRDVLHGGEGKDLVRGGAGADELNGGLDKDNLQGGDDNDVLDGGQGADRLSGGAGSDTFAFGAAGDSTVKDHDLITDLTISDIIDLSAIDANEAQDGDQAFHLVTKFSHHAGELTLKYDKSSGVTLLQGDVDGDGAADLSVWIKGDQHHFASFVL